MPVRLQNAYASQVLVFFTKAGFMRIQPVFAPARSYRPERKMKLVSC